MKDIATGLIALAIAAGFASQADASVNKKRKGTQLAQHHTYSPRAYRQRDDDDNPYGYYEHRLEAVRFGSKRWWKIYDEQSGGGQRR